MKRIKTWLQKMKKNPKLRCGSYSILLTCGVIICVLLAGWLCDTLENRFALTVDCSFNQATSQGEVTETVLTQLEKDVHIYALITEEGRNTTLLSLLDRYAATRHVTVSEESLVKNPVLRNQFSDALGENEVKADCLIVHCPDTNRSRVLMENDYYTYDYDPETGYITQGYLNYEKCITEAILYVTQDELPIIQILTGHGELTATEAVNMEDTLVSANYTLERVNLSAGGQLNPENLLMILCPQYDLTERELSLISEFTQAGGNLFILTAYDNPSDLANFNALLRSYGVSFHPGLVIAQESDTDSYFADSPVLLMPYMQETDVTRTLMEAGKNILVLTGARAFQIPDILPEGVALAPVLVTGQAYIRNFLDGLNTSQQQENDLTGRFPVALWSDKMFDNGIQSHAFVMGEEVSFLDYYQLTNTDSKPFLLQMVRSLHGQAPVNLDIMPKEGIRNGLYLGSITPAIIVVAMLPLLVILGAALVLLPRKNL